MGWSHIGRVMLALVCICALMRQSEGIERQGPGTAAVDVRNYIRRRLAFVDGHQVPLRTHLDVAAMTSIFLENPEEGKGPVQQTSKDGGQTGKDNPETSQTGLGNVAKGVMTAGTLANSFQTGGANQLASSMTGMLTDNMSPEGKKHLDEIRRNLGMKSTGYVPVMQRQKGPAPVKITYRIKGRDILTGVKKDGSPIMAHDDVCKGLKNCPCAIGTVPCAAPGLHGMRQETLEVEKIEATKQRLAREAEESVKQSQAVALAAAATENQTTTSNTTNPGNGTMQSDPTGNQTAQSSAAVQSQQIAKAVLASSLEHNPLLKTQLDALMSLGVLSKKGFDVVKYKHQ